MLTNKLKIHKIVIAHRLPNHLEMVRIIFLIANLICTHLMKIQQKTRLWEILSLYLSKLKMVISKRHKNINVKWPTFWNNKWKRNGGNQFQPFLSTITNRIKITTTPLQHIVIMGTNIKGSTVSQISLARTF